MFRTTMMMMVVVLGLLVSTRASAQAPDEVIERVGPAPAANVGSFLPMTLSARASGARATAQGYGGYDSSRAGPLFSSTAEVTVWGPFDLRVSAAYSNDTNRMRPSVGARARLLRQEAHGVDGALAVFFKTEGFTEPEGEIETFVTLGRRVGPVYLLGNFVYGQDPEGNERDGEVRAAVLRQGERVVWGLDSRLRFAIGTQHGKAAMVEPTFDLFGGPSATVIVGPVALFAEAGPSAFRLNGQSTRWGVAALGGIGAPF